MELLRGKHWIKFNQTDSRLIELVWLLEQAEKFINQSAPTTQTSLYWGLSGNAVCDKYLKDIGYGLPISYKDVVQHIPRLQVVMEDLNLFPYIGHNIISNWGIHRHHAGSKIHWNLCIMGKGNNGGSLEFYESNDSIPVTDIPVNEHNDTATTLVERVGIAEGDIFSINTWTWHSHKTPNNNADTFLLHFNK